VKLRIISPHYSETHETNWIEVNTLDGSAVIQPGHAPILFALAVNKDLSFSLKSGEVITILLTRGGFLEINRNYATALINQEITTEN
jgi:F0F1-type ATP synthase epsilon subunit